MTKRVVGNRILIGLALAALVAAPMAASARDHDGWGRDDGYRRGWDHGYRDGWRHDGGHRDGRWSGGRWIAGALVVGAVAGLVQSAVAAPAPAYYESAPPVVYREPTVVYREPPVVYRQPTTVVYESQPVVTRTVVYGAPYGGRYGDDDDGD